MRWVVPAVYLDIMIMVLMGGIGQGFEELWIEIRATAILGRASMLTAAHIRRRRFDKQMPMSAFPVIRSALPPKADIPDRPANVRE